MRLADLVATSDAVAATRGRRAKTALLAEGLRRLSPGLVGVGCAWLTGELPQGRLGIGPAQLAALRAVAPAAEGALTVGAVDETLGTLRGMTGQGSAAARRKALAGLFARATAAEQDFLLRLLSGELRQGALGGVMQEAIAEVIALRPDGTPHPFQVTMRRFGRRLGIEQLTAELPLSAFFFDCLHADGRDLVHEPLAARLVALDATVPATMVMPRLLRPTPAAAERFMAEALARGHEGVMAKALAGPYEAGSRGGSWRKIKRAHTLDLVVLAAEWGSGRRRGYLSNLHLGAHEGDGFVMLGKTFKGMTDEMLAWQTARLQALATGADGHVVQVRPELVVEIAFNDLQESPHYPGGLALRFARVKRYREDKRPAEADDMATVRRLHRQQGAARDFT